MSKMTDKDIIIKALECCNKPVGKTSCEDCPLHHSQGRCTENMLTNALDLINRQQTEIERLNSCIKSEDEVRAIANATIQAGIKIIKTTAIEEFAEKYEKVLLSMLTTATLEKREVIYSCLDTLEEMIGKE